MDNSWSHLKSDIADLHGYWSVPDITFTFHQMATSYPKAPGATFMNYPETQRRGDEPLMLSEFGNWGLPELAKLRKCYGGTPWWFSLCDGVLKPEGVEERFKEFHLDTVFRDYDDLARSFQEQEWRALKYQIEEMRQHPEFAGYVITEFTDAQIESNGLLDMARNPKTFYDLMHTLQDQDIVFATSDKVNHSSGEEARLSVFVSHFSDGDLSNASVKWSVEHTGLRGAIKLDGLGRGDAKQVGSVEFAAPEVGSPATVRLRLSLIGPTGKEINTNYCDLKVFPRPEPEMPDDVIVTGIMDKATVERVRSGANAVICIERPETVPEMKGKQKITSRDIDGRWGIWCSSVTWFKDSPASMTPPGARAKRLLASAGPAATNPTARGTPATSTSGA